MRRRLSPLASAVVITLVSAPVGCGPLGESADGGSTGGASGSSGAGSGSGGAASGGAGSGGLGSGGLGSGGIATGGAGSGGTSTGGAGGGTTVPATFATVREVIVHAHCGDASCHNGEVQPRMQDDAMLYTTLTTYISEACGNIPVVTPGDPERSAIVKLINGPCGEIPRMPNGCISEPVEEYTCLPQDYIDAIEQWVAIGAPQ